MGKIQRSKYYVRAKGSNSVMNVTKGLIHFQIIRDDLTEDPIHFPKYSSYHSLRSNNIKGGGVSVYISNSFKVKVIAECTVLNDNIETCFLDLKGDNKRIVLGIVYRPPSCV